MYSNLLKILSFLPLAYLFNLNISFSQSFIEPPKMIENQIIVKMQKGESPEILCRQTPAYFELKVYGVLSEYADIWLLEFNQQNTDVFEVMNFVNMSNIVLFSQPNRLVKLRQAPNDTYYGSQWQHQKIDAESAWDITIGGTTPNGTDIVVALIESADIINHVDLKDNRWINTAEIPNNGIDDDGNGYIDDYNGWNVSTQDDNIGAGSHGTSCAGMIGAKGNNGLGVAGINWNIKIMDIAGYNNPFTEANIVQSYDYALNARNLWNQTNGQKGAFVVATSSSWGIDGGNPSDYPIWCSFYEDLGEVGILNAGATTNSNYNVDQTGDVPSACPSDYMISVTATNQSDIIDFAGYGQNTIDVAAPGSSIITTAPNNNYTSTSGTSFATPYTAGLIALMYSVPCLNLEIMAKNNPQGTADIVRQALLDGVDKTQYLLTRTISGGRINAKKSIDLLMDEVCTNCIIPDNVDIQNIGENEATISFNSSGDFIGFYVVIQVAGTNNWSVNHTESNNYTFSDLESCTEYEFYLTANCDNGETSPETMIFSFTTSGCGNCIDLNYCQTTANDPNTRFFVDSPTEIISQYNYVPTNNFGGNVANGYVYGNLVIADDGTNNSDEGCGTFINASSINGNIALIVRGTCTFAEKVMNAQNAGAKAAVIINNVPGPPIEMGGTNSNIIIPAVMISQTDGNTILAAINNGKQVSAVLGKQNEWIESFGINGSMNVTGDNSGYLLSSGITQLMHGQNYSFTLIPGFSGDALPEYTRIWLDANQDGIFSNNELIYDQGSPSLGTVNGNFIVPPSALIGNTRLRVQLSYQTANINLPSVCGSFISGEVEDYCVTIQQSGTDNPVGLTEENSLTSINIFPNPVKNTITVYNNLQNEDGSLHIYNNNGQLIQLVTLTSGANIVDVKDLDAAIYFFKIYGKNDKLLSTHKVCVLP